MKLLLTYHEMLARTAVLMMIGHFYFGLTLANKPFDIKQAFRYLKRDSWGGRDVV